MIALCPLEGGSSTMKSTKMEDQGPYASCGGTSNPTFANLLGLDWQHTRNSLVNFVTSAVIPFQE